MAQAAAKADGAGFVIRGGDVPVLPGVWEYIAAGYLTQRLHHAIPEHFGAHVHFAADVTPAQRTLLWEAETSGGLLLAVPAANEALFRQACAERKQACWDIGEVVAGAGIQVI